MVAVQFSADEEDAFNKAAERFAKAPDEVARDVLLDWLEEQQDLIDSDRIMAEIASGKQKTVPFEEVLAEHGMAPRAG